MDNTLQQAQAIQDELIRLRRIVHQHPELGFQEQRTAALVAETLQKLGLRVQTGVGKTGVIGYLGQGQPVIAIRADMDALPIQEENDVPYASRVPGVMHACGHDTHVACALGAAMLLSRDDLPGQVRFLFQPAEEMQDEEGKSGAMRMVEEGAMEGVDAVIALHISSEVPLGVIRVSAGAVSAAVDTFYGTVRGQGCHGAYPHKGVDPIYLQAQVVLAIHAIASRRIDPVKPAVVSVGSVHGGQADNVIPDAVQLTGTVRSMDEEVRRQLHQEIERAFGVARALGGDYELRIEWGYPVMYNHPDIVELIRQVGADLLGAENVQEEEVGMGAEDFGYMTQKVPGAMFSLGGQLQGKPRPAHSPIFDIDERALPIGTAILVETVRRYLLGGESLS